MPEMRKDPIRDEWVIIATDQALKPRDFPINKCGVQIGGSQTPCPFCEGNEALTTLEIAAFRPANTRPNQAGWLVRTIPNKFSPFKLQGDFHLDQAGLYTSHNGLGQHEVVVETPEHGLQMHEFSLDNLILVYRMLRDRYNVLARDQRVKYIQIYKNRGLFAGASQDHSHSQVLALPMLPSLHRGVGNYYLHKGKCLLCAIVRQELEAAVRIVYEDKSFLVFCPYASRFSYETWIVPKKHREHFGQLPDHDLQGLAGVVHIFLPIMVDILQDPSYNIVINSSPVNTPGIDGYHCFMEISPRLMIQNGMELSCGYYINPVAPEFAAAALRQGLKTRHIGVQASRNSGKAGEA